MSNFTNGLIMGLLRATPVIGAFAAYTATRDRGWGTWSSAFIAAGAVLGTSIIGATVEDVLEEKGVITGIQVTRRRVAGWGTPGDLRRSGNLYGLRGWETPNDLRRSGNLYGLGNQQVPGSVNANWQSKGALGLIEVRRYV